MVRASKKEQAKRADDGLSDDDEKLLDIFLKGVDNNLWSVGKEDRVKALADLRAHIIGRSKDWRVDNALEMSLFSLGSPEVIARGIRTLYGYGTGFKAFLVVIAVLLAIPTVPYFLAWAIISIVILFFVISNFGMKTNVVVGGLMGLGAAISRGVTALLLVRFNPTGLTNAVHDETTALVLGGNQAMIDFLLVSMFLVLVGLLAGHIREKAVRSYLKLETYAT